MLLEVQVYTSEQGLLLGCFFCLDRLFGKENIGVLTTADVSDR